MQKQFLLFLLALSVCAAQSQNSIPPLFEEYYEADGFYKKSKAAKKIISAGISFQEIFSGLSEGRHYLPDKRKGFTKVRQVGEHLPPSALVFVPYDYTPLKKYPVTVYLHGAVSNLDPDFIYHHFVDTLNAAYKKIQSIYIYPSGWLWAPWWSKAQYENINHLIAAVKQDYNVDESQIRLGGISDGGTGSYYLANCNRTPWSAVTPFIGSLEVLNYLKVRPTFMSNYEHVPFYIVNTGRDTIFPKVQQAPYLKLLSIINPLSTQIMIDSASHSMNWFPLLRDSINNFIKQHPRNPFPSKLSWSTDSDKENNRCFYLVANKLGSNKPNKMHDRYNEIEVNGKKTLAHARDSVYGHIEVVVSGNVVNVRTENIKKYTLLISPSQFAIDQPIVVWTNGIKSFEGIITPDVNTLLRWNIIDQDRTMLFAAEVPVTVKF